MWPASFFPTLHTVECALDPFLIKKFLVKFIMIASVDFGMCSSLH